MYVYMYVHTYIVEHFKTTTNIHIHIYSVYTHNVKCMDWAIFYAQSSTQYMLLCDHPVSLSHIHVHIYWTYTCTECELYVPICASSKIHADWTCLSSELVVLIHVYIVHVYTYHGTAMYIRTCIYIQCFI